MTTPSVFTVDAVDLSATVTPDWSLTQSADKGTTATSGWNLDDGTSAKTVPALKDTTVEIPAATNPRLFTGYTIDRSIGRNQDAAMGPASSDRRWAVNVTDLNALLSLVVLRGNNANRPAETDIDRITWVLSYLNLSGVFDNGFIDSSSPVPMDATNYAGQFPADVLATCSEASGLNHFVDWDPSALQATLNYRVDGSSVSRSSDVLISNNPSDIDGVNTFGPSMDASLGLDPRNVYSGVLYNFAGGAYIYVTRPATATAYRVRETSITSDQVGHAATATALATAYLDRIATELTQISVRIRLKRADVTRVQAGMRIQVKFTEVPGFTTFQWININKLTTTPTDDSQQFFWCDLVLLNLLPTGFAGASTPPGTSNPAPGPGTSASPCGITDTFDRADQVDLGTASSGYLWSTSGGDMQIVSDQGSSPSAFGQANLAAPIPLPMHGQIDLTGATLISQFGYVSASGLAGWHQSGGGTAIASSNGSVATIRDAITNSIVFKASGAISIAFVIPPLGGIYTPPDHIVLALGGSSTSVAIVGDSLAGNVQLEISDGSGSPGHSDTAVLDASWAHFQGAGLAGTLLITQDVVTGVITASIGAVSVSCLGNGSGGPADSEFVINNTNSEGYDFEISAITFDGSNEITTYGWNWIVGGPTDLVYTDYVQVTIGYVGTDGALPLGMPAVATPCLYIMANSFSGNSVFASTTVPSDFSLAFPFTPVVDLTATDATLTIGGFSATVTFASATPSPIDPIAFIDAGVTHMVQAEGLIASDLTFNDLDITGVNGCSAAAAGIPVSGTPTAGSLIIATSPTAGSWLSLLVRHAAGVPSGAPAPGELPIAVDTTAVTGGVYFWTGSAWVKGAAI